MMHCDSKKTIESEGLAAVRGKMTADLWVLV